MSLLLDSAIAQIGKLHDGPDVVRMAREIGEMFPRLATYCANAKPDTPWCGIFIAWLLAQQGIEPPYNPSDDTGSFMFVDAWAKTNWGGTHVADVEAMPGDIVARKTPHHVNIIKRVEGGRHICVGGNQTGPSGNPDSVTEASYASTGVMAIIRPPLAGGVIVPSDDPLEIKLGSTGASVTELQRLLGIDQDGEFGPDTEAAVRAFQAARGLEVDGEVGPATWAALLEPQQQPANVLTSKGSWYSQYNGKFHWHDDADTPNSAALGVPDDAQGVAMPIRDMLGRWYAVRAPNDKVSIEQVTDLGPAAFTGRTIDISAAAAERFGYSPLNFPTDGIFTFWPVPVPAEVAGLSKQNQAIQYRDIRKGLPLMPDPVPQPAPPPIAPKPIPQPQLPAVLSSSIDVGRILQFVVDHRDEAQRVLMIAINLHNALHPDHQVIMPGSAAPAPVAPAGPSVLEKPSVLLGTLGAIGTALLHQTGTIGADTGILSGILSLGTAAIGATGGWGMLASMGLNLIGALARATPQQK